MISEYSTIVRDIEIVAKAKEAQINRYVDLSKGYMDIITIAGNDYFEHKDAKNSELFKFLKYDTNFDTYNLDSIGGTAYQRNAGNLTGNGQIPDNGVERVEINLALNFSESFISVYRNLPDLTWLYYTSENDFIYMYPWQSSEKFKYTSDLKTEKFYSCVFPENNPNRQAVWTPVYSDRAGKGLMVTLSSPIYNKDTFMGAVSLDLTNNLLSEMLSDYIVGEAYIVDQTGSVIATNTEIKSDNKIIKFDEILKASRKDVKVIKEIEPYKLQLYGNYYIYSVKIDNAPWSMYFRMPIDSILGNSFLFTIPILIISLLLLFVFIENEKRRKTEIKLKNSLEELKSYHALLENAAKYDFLTSTVNRRGLIDIFDKIIISDKENNIETRVFFVMGDIDNFKQFNDTYGHSAGDQVLKEIVKILQNSIGKFDVVCRWGGEEFVIMLLHTNCDEVMMIAEKIRKKIEEHFITWENGSKLRATMSFGVAEHKYGDTLHNSVNKADEALYKSKENGRNQVVFFGKI